mgnify:CR=1 FL=1
MTRKRISLYLKARVSPYQLWELWEKAFRYHELHPTERRFPLTGVTDWRSGKPLDVSASVEEESAGDVIILRLVEEDEPL